MNVGKKVNEYITSRLNGILESAKEIIAVVNTIIVTQDVTDEGAKRISLLASRIAIDESYISALKEGVSREVEKYDKEKENEF